MKSVNRFSRGWFGILALGLAVFLVLAVRFSPDWVSYSSELHEAFAAAAADPTHKDPIARAILSGNSERGYYVLQQARSLATGIPDPMHKAVRWRLLVPLLALALNLPEWATLALAHLGCVALVLLLVTIGVREAPAGVNRWSNGLGLGVVAGATAPFFTSMGWLGYYDSWLAIALLLVAFGRTPSVLLTVCLLAPWIDERFVLGFPLALVVRALRTCPADESPMAWLRREALAPLFVVFAYALLRLGLSGTGSSQSVGDYLDRFVLMERIPALQRVFGAWAGLGVGWALILTAVVVCWRAREPARAGCRRGPLLGGGVACTALVGSFTALDLARSTVLILPVVPLGWILASRSRWWHRWHAAPLLVVLALLLPAHHVYGRLAVPVDNAWSPSLALTGAQNNLGVLFRHGEGVPRDPVAAAKWFRRAADQGHAPAQNNLGLAYQQGEGVPRDAAAAARWYRRAAAQGVAAAQASLGDLHANGEGVPKDINEAVKWYRRAAEQGYAPAQSNLGVIYAEGRGVPKDPVEAVKWYRRAAEQGNAIAQVNLGVAYANGQGVAPDRVEAARWYIQAARRGHPTARNNLGIMFAEGDVLPRNLVLAHMLISLAEADGDEHAPANLELLEESMSPEQIAEARARMVRDE